MTRSHSFLVAWTVTEVYNGPRLLCNQHEGLPVWAPLGSSKLQCEDAGLQVDDPLHSQPRMVNKTFHFCTLV